ncbi:IS3 family transposase [Hymenobacter coccineus]|uniref:IS3 family transposase n=1 Tax=Hymenobacter coccineus TaxID=1908235 RepID=UPI0034DB214A
MPQIQDHGAEQEAANDVYEHSDWLLGGEKGVAARGPGLGRLAQRSQLSFVPQGHAQRYGTRRLRAELHAKGYAVGRNALRTWLRRRGLRALSTRPQRPRTTELTRRLSWRRTCCLASPRPPRPIRRGWATLPAGPWSAGAGAT